MQGRLIAGGGTHIGHYEKHHHVKRMSIVSGSDQRERVVKTLKNIFFRRYSNSLLYQRAYLSQQFQRRRPGRRRRCSELDRQAACVETDAALRRTATAGAFGIDGKKEQRRDKSPLQHLYHDVRSLLTFIQENHGNPFRRIELSVLLDAKPQKPKPSTQQSSQSFDEQQPTSEGMKGRRGRLQSATKESSVDT